MEKKPIFYRKERIRKEQMMKRFFPKEKENSTSKEQKEISNISILPPTYRVRLQTVNEGWLWTIQRIKWFWRDSGYTYYDLRFFDREEIKGIQSTFEAAKEEGNACCTQLNKEYLRLKNSQYS